MGHRKPLVRFLQQAAFAGLLAGALSLCTLIEIHAAQSQRQQLVAAVKESCRTSKAQLEQTQLPNLRKKQTAFRVLFTDWKEKMPAHLRENMPAQLQDGLNVEVPRFNALLASYDALEYLLKACEAVTDHPGAIAQLADGATQLDDKLKQLQALWNQRPQARADFKSSLNKTVDLMLQYNAPKASTYITMKVELDPDRLDDAITYQRSLLISVQVGLNLLK